MSQPEEAREKTAKTDDVLFAQPPAGSDSPGYQNPTGRLAPDAEPDDSRPDRPGARGDRPERD
jgi:hypothetical protein